MEKISVKCKSCGADFQVPASLAGQRGKCSCGKVIEVPTLEQLSTSETLIMEQSGRPVTDEAEPEPYNEKAAPTDEDGEEEQDEDESGAEKGEAADEWYFMKHGVQQGPISSKGIRMLLDSEDLKPTDQIWSPSMDSWLPVSKVPEFAPGPAKEAAEPKPADEKAAPSVQSVSGEGSELTFGPAAAQAAQPQAQAAPKQEPTANEMWYFSAGGVAQGPVTFGQLGQMLQNGQLAANDMVFSTAIGSWRAIGDVPQFASLVPRAAAEPAGADWYLAIAGQTYGPYPTESVRQMLQAGQVAPETMVFSQHLGTWTAAGNVAEFSTAAQPQQPAPEPEPAPEPAAQPPIVGQQAQEQAASQWYAIRGGEQIGPYSRKEMILIVKRGGLSGEDLVWAAELGDWRPVSRVPVLAEVLPKKASIEDQAHPWYFTVKGQTAGPLGYEEVYDLVARGQIGAKDLVFSKQIGTWQEVHKVDKLRFALEEARRGPGAGSHEEAPDEWFFMDHGERKGPISKRLLSNFLRGGTVQPGTMVWRQDMAQWQPMSGVAEFAPVAAEVAAAGAAPQQQFVSRDAPTALVDRDEVEAEKKTPESAPVASATADLAADSAPESAAPARAFAPGPKPKKKKKGKGMVVAAVLGVLLLLGALGAACFLLQDQWGKEGTGENRPTGNVPVGPPTTGNTGTQQPVKSVDESEMILSFLTGFLSGDDKKRDRAREAYCPGGWLDVYSDDIESRARFLLQSVAPEIKEIPCNIMRYAEKDVFFSYHVKTTQKRFDLEYKNERGDRSEKTAFLKDFTPLRCFAVLWPGGHALSEMRVVVMGRGADMNILALGRAGYVGACASGKQIVYMTGYLQRDMYETLSHIVVKTGPAPAGAKVDWNSYGIAMCADPRVVPVEVKRKYSRNLAERKEFANDWNLMNMGPELSRTEIEEKYGKPERTDKTKLFDAGFMMSAIGDDFGISNKSLTVDYYGPVGFVYEPNKPIAMGIVMSLPKSKVPQ